MTKYVLYDYFKCRGLSPDHEWNGEAVDDEFSMLRNCYLFESKEEAFQYRNTVLSTGKYVEDALAVLEVEYRPALYILQEKVNP